MLVTPGRGPIAAVLLLAFLGCKQPTRRRAASNRAQAAADEMDSVDTSSKRAFTASFARLFVQQSERVHATVLEPLTIELVADGSDKGNVRVSPETDVMLVGIDCDREEFAKMRSASRTGTPRRSGPCRRGCFNGRCIIGF